LSSWLEGVWRQPPARSGPGLIQRIERSRSTVTREGVAQEDGGWRVDVTGSKSIPLFEIVRPDIHEEMLRFRARLRSADVGRRAFLEIRCRFPDGGEYFSKGISSSLQGTNDWESCEVPFYLKGGGNPDVVRLNLTVEGGGQVWIKDVELSEAALA
jgi:hypothetical protein